MATSMAAATIGHVKLLRPLRERDFALLWTGMTVSLLGDGTFIVAEAWQVDRRHAALHRLRLRHDRVAAHGLRRRLRAGETAGMVVWGTLMSSRVAPGLRGDEERHPLLGEDYAGAGASSAVSGSGTPAIS
jgi:hypothetical protein